jgi:serine/threonine-protein phosphatase 2A regulatory subunit A
MVSNALSVDSLARYVLPLIKKLSGDWFTSRISAASLFHVVYPRANAALRKDIRAMYVKLCTDDTPMVRRAICANTGKLASVVEFAFVKTEMWGPFSLVAKDDQDSVRLLLVTSCYHCSPLFRALNIVWMIGSRRMQLRRKKARDCLCRLSHQPLSTHFSRTSNLMTH